MKNKEQLADFIDAMINRDEDGQIELAEGTLRSVIVNKVKGMINEDKQGQFCFYVDSYRTVICLTDRSPGAGKDLNKVIDKIPTKEKAFWKGFEPVEADMDLETEAKGNFEVKKMTADTFLKSKYILQK